MPHYVTAKRNSVEKGVGRRYTAQQHQVTLQSINGFQNITFIFYIYLHVNANVVLIRTQNATSVFVYGSVRRRRF